MEDTPCLLEDPHCNTKGARIRNVASIACELLDRLGIAMVYTSTRPYKDDCAGQAATGKISYHQGILLLTEVSYLITWKVATPHLSSCYMENC